MTRLLTFSLLALPMLWPALASAAPAGGEGDGAPERTELLDLKPMEAVWTLVVFGLFFGVLSLVVWPKILTALRAREDKIRGDLTDAEQARAEAESLKEDFAQKIAEAHAESRKLLDQTRADAGQLRAKLQADTEAELVRVRERAAEDIDRAKQQALQDLYATSAELATAVAAKILQRQVDDADTQKLVDQSLAELENKAG